MDHIIDLTSGSDNDGPITTKKQKLDNMDTIELLTDDEQVLPDATLDATSDVDQGSQIVAEPSYNANQGLLTAASALVKIQDSEVFSSDVIANEDSNAIVENNLLDVLREEPLPEDFNQPDCLTADGATHLPENVVVDCGTSTEVADENKAIILPKQLDEFFCACMTNLSTQCIKRKIRTIQSTALLASDYVSTDDFITELQHFQSVIDKEPNKTALYFKKLYKLLVSKENVRQPGDDVEDVKLNLVLNNLYDKLEKVKQRIHELEQEEVDFDEEDNSSYIKLQKYNEKAAQILSAIAKLEKRSPYSGLAYFSRLDFSGSNITAFNVALSRKYRNREEHSFPNFYDVNVCLRKCVRRNKIEIEEKDLKTEIELCFKKLGKLLKKRRQKDLESLHHNYLIDSKDPATQDPQLERKLRDNRRHCRNRLDNVLKKFAGMQETGVEPELSEDSDDSRRADSVDNESADSDL